MTLLKPSYTLFITLLMISITLPSIHLKTFSHITEMKSMQNFRVSGKVKKNVPHDVYMRLITLVL